MEKSQHFHRAMELNLSIGSESMRELTRKYLKDKGVTLKEHLQEPTVKQILEKLRLFPDQKQILADPDPTLSSMDVSLLTIVLLNTFPGQINQGDKKSIEGLKDKRNQLSHKVKAELNDDKLFKESSQLILTISKSIDRTFNQNMVKSINELRRRELVRTCSNLDRIQINNEIYMLKLAESCSTDQVDRDMELMIKFGLTKWIRQLSRGVDVAEFLKILNTQSIISEIPKKRDFEQEYSNEGQMRLLVLHMVNHGTKMIS
ncbi:uncharacterized protein LOC128549290 [Mercenaria mercenaria]|uniref:uncharacterized protein LOC128549290 n=1 Tax=Mercenaria mercenaria TaxID=6596 RepID=UPI00234EF4DA|nr:uncharacterized protein LOC128549290 [Mercenaria mercenaria]